MSSTTIATISDGSNSVDILFNKLEHDYDKQLTIIAIPKNTDANNACPETTETKNPLNFNIDLQRLKQVITVTGYLEEESGTTALNKKDALEVMLSGTGNLTLEWNIGSTTITKTGTVIKCKITEMAERIGDQHPATQGKSLMIQLQFGVGQHKG